ncbi:LLM class flavin-dependent oxidoreductase [Streptomyces cuspidosporus]|uniref:LLM class flavin-dependent oxidoreductase n=2 Tax=Streptomyces cuspidosporus TaxID=66882 RepID=A0ABN3H034_9ACTN
MTGREGGACEPDLGEQARDAVRPSYARRMIETPLSALEVAMVQTGTRAVDTLRDTAAFARRLDALGYLRLWYAEHHHSPAIGAFPPVVLTAHAAASTSAIRLGSGGVLAPNHAPIMLAEQFGTLAALHPDRIDLGIGRGPGTFDESTARALRRGAGPTTDDEYREDVAATLRFLVDEVALGPLPEPWLLASSTAGAALAAELGLPIAFAHHIRPDNTLAALDHYRARFSPSPWCASPRVLVCVETVCAETEEEAVRLAGPMDVVKAGLLKGQSDIPFPSPEEAAAHPFTADERRALTAFRAQQAHGTPDTVVRRLAEVAETTGADELMLSTPVYALAARLRSYELVTQHATAPSARP